MPALSKAQYRAMQAALHGKSTLGIPKDVGAEFVGATENPSALPDEYHAHCTERCDHHRKLARRSLNPSTRAMHRKLQKHYERKLKENG